ncbi:MAG: alginate export family protein [Rickettsiales bacterium]|nr:alginate export family protein [Rickettsiales bacterium]
MVAMSPAYASETDVMQKFLIDDATPYIDVRYRFEHVDQAGFGKDANASTLRTKLGYKTGTLEGFSGVVEIENVAEMGGETYNDTINGKTAYPVVADPDGTEVNKAYLQFTGIDDTVLRVGRQDHNLDNQRFIGTVGWRQNDQMYDSAAIINSSLPDTTLVYSYVDNVNRIFSDDHPFGDLDTNTHVINASYDGWDFGKLTGYGYLIDLDDAAVAGLSSKTFGARFTGSTPIDENVKLLYTAEYARQSEHGDNPIDYSADYYTLEGGLAYAGLTAKAGFESLGSDNGGTVSFQTPLATLHKFNGWADKFLATPATGLEDIYGSLFYKASGTGSEIVDGTTFGVIYHDFSAETGGANYGNEWDAVIKRNFMDHYSVMLKYADYDADTLSTDTEKFWFQLGAKL